MIVTSLKPANPGIAKLKVKPSQYQSSMALSNLKFGSEAPASESPGKSHSTVRKILSTIGSGLSPFKYPAIVLAVLFLPQKGCDMIMELAHQQIFRQTKVDGEFAVAKEDGHLILKASRFYKSNDLKNTEHRLEIPIHFISTGSKNYNNSRMDVPLATIMRLSDAQTAAQAAFDEHIHPLILQQIEQLSRQKIVVETSDVQKALDGNKKNPGPLPGKVIGTFTTADPEVTFKLVTGPSNSYNFNHAD